MGETYTLNVDPVIRLDIGSSETGSAYAGKELFQKAFVPQTDTIMPFPVVNANSVTVSGVIR